MVSFPNAKINIGLNIIGRRNDGFHDLETIFFPIHLRDILEITESESNDEITYTQSGNIIAGTFEDNLCIKAFRLLKREYPALPNVRMHLHKKIPSGAGLGGGSADASFALKLLNEKFKLNIKDEDLINLSLELGSDCPFFILNKPCFATGRGEILSPFALSLEDYKLLIVNPGIHVNTGDAFRALVIKDEHSNLLEAIQLPPALWKNNIFNEFETGVFKKHPEIESLKKLMYDYGAIYSSMSGSGSTVYGIFEKEFDCENKFPSGCFYNWV